MYPRPPRAGGFPKGRAFPSLTTARNSQPSPAGGRRSAPARTDPPNIFSFPPGAAQKVNCPAGAREAPLEGFLFDVSMRGPRRAPRGGKMRSAQAHEVGAEVPLGCKGAGAVFAAGGNGAERTLRRRQWGAHPPWKRPPGGSQIPVAAVQRPAQPKRAVFIPPLRWKSLPPHAPSEPWRSLDLPPP